jgi:sodium/potassium-transporting ATPase subunit alpha
LAQSAEGGETLIALEINRFVKMVAVIAISMGVIFFIINILYGADIISNLIFCIGILVANIPEGLQITVTVCMALTAKRMAAKKVLVKNLQSVETLGCTSCICSDKTGTLTQNKMTVSHLFYGGQLIEADINYE